MFKNLLERAGISKTKLALKLGLHQNTVSNWGNNPPQYAIAYLDLLIEYNRVRP